MKYLSSYKNDIKIFYRNSVFFSKFRYAEKSVDQLKDALNILMKVMPICRDFEKIKFGVLYDKPTMSDDRLSCIPDLQKYYAKYYDVDLSFYNANSVFTMILIHITKRDIYPLIPLLEQSYMYQINRLIKEEKDRLLVD
jgi:hypothetical protein